MSNERFTLRFEKIGKYWDMGIVDHETKEPFDESVYEFHPNSFQDSKDEMEDLCQLMNELAEENEQLKLDLKVANDGADLYKDINEALEKENEQLKQEIKTLRYRLSSYETK